MGWFKKEAKAFGKEFARQGSILLFGSAPKPRHKSHRRKISGAEKQYHRAQSWGRRYGYIK